MREVGQELAGQGRLCEAKSRSQGIQSLGAHLALKASKHGGGWISGHQPWDEEIEGQRSEGSDDVKA
jgi:hypothetical protein